MNTRAKSLMLLALAGVGGVLVGCGSETVESPATTQVASTTVPTVPTFSTDTTFTTIPTDTTVPTNTFTTDTLTTTTVPTNTFTTDTLTAATVPTDTFTTDTFTTDTFTTAPSTATPSTATVTVTTSRTPTTTPRRLRPGVPVVSPARYQRDVLTSLTALRGFASTLQSVDNNSEFRARLPTLRTQLRNFDAAIRRLRRYQLRDATLDRQRARLGREGPPLAAAMSDLLDAVRDRDQSAAARLGAEVQRRLVQFQVAARVN